MSMLFKDTETFAIDLSLSSLAFALRKTLDLGIPHLTYARGDILELGTLDREFDIVVSAGVLHHLDQPLQGWRALKNVTRPGGAMLIALYSALARRELEPARAFARERGYEASGSGLRQFRSDVLSLPATVPWRAALLARDDFYNLSMLRDLLFHAREKQFTISKIGDALVELDLVFCGFATDREIQQKFRDRFGGPADLLSLDQWEIFEQENPDAFSGMYHFLVQKRR
jgi:SAM-dependent methyltransferase